MSSLPELRAIIDWDNNAFFESFPSTDPLNLIPTALSLVDVDITASGVASSFTEGAELTDYGVRYQRSVMGTSVFGGIVFGQSAGGTINTIPISASTTYRATCWMRGVSGSYGSVPVVLQSKDQGLNILGTSSNVTLTSSWQKVTVTFSTGVGDTHLALFVLKNNTATNITIDVTGLMLTAGSGSVDAYNTGETYCRYEDVTADVVSASWDSGMDRKSHIADEGQLTLVLKNDTRKYSKRYASSPLYGAFKNGLRVRIEIKRPSTGAWVVMWAGWISEYRVTPGGNRDNLAEITAVQGIFKLDDAPLSLELAEDTTLDAVLPDILYSGWYPPTTPYLFVLGESRLGQDTYLPSQTDFIGTLETGITEFPLIGDAWADSETPASTALKDLNEVERGWLYLGRSGRFNFRNREAFLWDSTADFTLSLDTEANGGGTYVIAPVSITAATVKYYPAGELTDQVIWQRRTRKLVGSKRDRRVQAVFEFEEGTKVTVKSLNPFGSGGTDSTLDAVDIDGNPIDSRFISGTAELRNGKGVITVYNQSLVNAYVDITLKGTIERPTDSEEVRVVTDDPTAKLKEVPIDNKLLKTVEAAEDLGNYLIAFYGQEYDEFEEIEIQARDNDWVERQLNLTVGTIISLTEYQTAVEDMSHLVIGYNHLWTPNHLISRFKTMRIDPTEFWILGTSGLSHETVLAY